MLTGSGLISDDDLEELPFAERAYVRAATSPRLRRFRLGIAAARVRSGRVPSQGNAKLLASADAHLSKASEHVEKVQSAAEQVRAAHEAAEDALTGAQNTHDKMGEIIAAVEEGSHQNADNGTSGEARATVTTDPADGNAATTTTNDADDPYPQIRKLRALHRKLGRNLDALSDAHTQIGLAHGDTSDGVNATQRCMGAGQRCVRAVIEAQSDEDTKDIQTSAGTDDSAGSSNDRALTLEARKRRLALLELTAAS
jgi:hypothetical protein